MIARRSNAGISITQTLILGFFAPRERDAAPASARFDVEEVDSSTPNLTLIGAGLGMGPKKTKFY